MFLPHIQPYSSSLAFPSAITAEKAQLWACTQFSRLPRVCVILFSAWLARSYPCVRVPYCSSSGCLEVVLKVLLPLRLLLFVVWSVWGLGTAFKSIIFPGLRECSLALLHGLPNPQGWLWPRELFLTMLFHWLSLLPNIWLPGYFACCNLYCGAMSTPLVVPHQDFPYSWQCP